MEKCAKGNAGYFSVSVKLNVIYFIAMKLIVGKRYTIQSLVLLLSVDNISAISFKFKIEKKKPKYLAYTTLNM